MHINKQALPSGSVTGRHYRRGMVAIGLLGGGAVLAAAAQLGSQWLLARLAGPAAFGAFAAALALVTTVSPLAGFGAHRLLLKCFGEEGWGAMRWLRGVFRFGLLSTLALVVVLVVAGTLDGVRSGRAPFMAWLAPVVASQVVIDLVATKLQLEERFGSLACWQLMQPLLRLAFLAMAAVLFDSQVSAANAAACYGVIASAIVAVGVVLLHRVRSDGLVLSGHGLRSTGPALTEVPGATLVAKLSWPFGVDAICFLAYLQGGVVMLERVSGAASAGIYSIAMSMLMAAYLLPNIVYQKFLAARLLRWAVHDRDRLRRVHRASLRWMLLLAAVCVCGLWGIGHGWAARLLGPGYEQVGPVVTVLALCVPLKYASAGYGALMGSGNLISRKVRVLALAAGVNVVAALVLGRLYGAIGAAWAGVGAEAVVLAGTAWQVHRSGLIEEARG